MRILFFSNAYPNPISPGLGTFNRTMIAGLANTHDVRVVSPVPYCDAWDRWMKGKLPRGLNTPEYQAVAGVTAEYLTWYYTPKFFRHRYGQFMRHSVARALNRTIREFRPDIVLSYWTHPDGEVAVEAAHRFGIPAVTIVGGSDVLVNGRCGLRRKVTLDVLHAADGVITVSEDIKRVLIADGISSDKLHVVRRGIDRKVFHEADRKLARQKLDIPSDVPIVVSVGRLVSVKGHVHLIDACELLAKRNVDFQCHLLGDGPLRPAIQQQIEQRGLSNVVHLRGSQTPVQLAEWYRAADLSVLASLSEGVPNVLMESMACGTPFVASNVGGIPEIAEPELDSLVPVANPIALADAIEWRLTAKQSAISKPRRFHPLTVDESANLLSHILESVKGERFVMSHSDSDLAIIDKVSSIEFNDPIAILKRDYVDPAMGTTADARIWDSDVRSRFEGKIHGRTNNGSNPLQASHIPIKKTNTFVNAMWQLTKSSLAACIPRNRLLVRGPVSGGSRPRLALTFDDGPHPEHTPRLLGKLNELGLKATFFVIGRNAELHPEIVRRMVESGHEVANHTFTHSEPRDTSATMFLDEIRRTDDLLSKLTGRDVRTVRPPKGELSWTKLCGLWRDQKTIALWNVDPKDFRMQNLDEINRWCEDYVPNDGDIVLMHDTYPYAIQAVETMASQGVFDRFETTTIRQFTGKTERQTVS